MEKKIEEALAYYESNKSLFELLCKDASVILQKILDERDIKYQSISYRVKKYDSYKKKCEKEKYSNPKDEIKDIAGLRIVTYLDSDVKEIDNLIKELFEMDVQNSKDKKDDLEDDKVGYIAKHYVLKYNPERLGLPENRKFKDMYFELQVKTLLQHTWAEISHDRAYKFIGVLPSEIRRRLNLTAAILEMVDREFQNISNEINEYRIENEEMDYRDLNKSAKIVELTSISLFDYMKDNFSNVRADFFNQDRIIIDEIKAMGYSSLNEFDNAIKVDIYDKMVQLIISIPEDQVSYVGIIRTALLATDPQKYFSVAWKNQWAGLPKYIYDFVCLFHPDNNIRDYVDVE